MQGDGADEGRRRDVVGRDVLRRDVVGRLGIEPRTRGLKVRCSAG
jgi:hypothetical protein